MVFVQRLHALHDSVTCAALTSDVVDLTFKGLQVDFLINRLYALEEHMKAVEEQMALELDHRQASEKLECLP